MEEAKDTKATAPVEDSEKSCLFVTEDDRFDVVVKYNDEGGQLTVEGVDDPFTVTDKTKTLTVTLKYPSQGDYDIISNSFSKSFMNKDFDIKDYINMELIRLLTLVRKWSLKKPLTNDAVMQLHPRVVKAILNQVRDRIKMEGII